MSTLSYVQEIGFGDPTPPPPPVNQPHTFYAAAQAVSAFMPPHQSSGAYPPPSKSAICCLYAYTLKVTKLVSVNKLYHCTHFISL